MIITVKLIIFLVIIFVLVFLFVNTIDKRKWLTILVSLVLTPLVYFYVAYPLINIFSSYHHEKYFNAESWQEKPALRYEMMDDMVDSKSLIGKSKSEIETLLGSPEWLSWNDALKTHDNNKWNYALGLKPGAFNEQKECIELVFEHDTLQHINTYKEPLKFDAKE